MRQAVLYPRRKIRTRYVPPVKQSEIRADDVIIGLVKLTFLTGILGCFVGFATMMTGPFGGIISIIGILKCIHVAFFGGRP